MFSPKPDTEASSLLPVAALRDAAWGGAAPGAGGPSWGAKGGKGLEAFILSLGFGAWA